jgi:hypothetical protein
MQKVNLFFSFNMTNTLAAMLTVDKYFSMDKNILCIEKQKDRNESLYTLTDLLLKDNTTFDKIIYVDAQQYIFGKRDLLKVKEYINYYKKAYNYLIDELNKSGFEKVDRIFTSQVGRIWPFFEKSSEVYLIEHAFGDYYLYDAYNSNYASVTKKMNHALNKIWNIIFGYKFMNKTAQIDGAYFMLELIDDKNENIKLINNHKLINNIIIDFWKKFQKYYPKEYDEIVGLVDNNLDKEIYLYMPSNEVKNSKYDDFLKLQINSLNLDTNKLVILKQHPASSAKEHKLSLDNNFSNVKEMQTPLVLDIPIEFYTILYKKSFLIGTISSAFVYLKHLYKSNNIKVYTDIFTTKREFLDQEDPLEAGNNDESFTNNYIKIMK